MSASKTRLGRPVHADGDLTRSRVVTAARTAFAELGYAATTYRLLAERTGLAPSALYNYFRSKAALYAAVHAEVQRETYREWIEPARASADTFVGQVDAILESLVAMNAQDPEAAKFQAAARADTVRHAELSAVREILPTQRTILFCDLVDLGISTGELQASSRDSVLAMLETVTVGLVEISADADLHRTAVDAFRSALTTLLISTADQP